MGARGVLRMCVLVFVQARYQVGFARRVDVYVLARYLVVVAVQGGSVVAGLPSGCVF